MGGFSSGGSSGSSWNRGSGSFSNEQEGTSESSTNTISSGSSRPVVTSLWQQASDQAGGLLNSQGLSGSQQDALSFLSGVVRDQPMGWALHGLNSSLNQLANTPVTNIAGTSIAPQNVAAQNVAAQNVAAQNISAPLAVSTGQVSAPTAAAMLSPYAALYAQELIEPALRQYDYGTDRSFSALDARTAAGGAFGNSRSGLAYSDLAQQSAYGRAALEAQMRGQGLQSAIGAGQFDAANALSASGQNATNALNASGQNATNALNVNTQNAANALSASGQNATNFLNASGQNAANALNASGQNATNALNANQFNANQQYQAALANQNAELAARAQALQAYGQQAQNNVNINTMGIGNTQALYNMGGGGLTNFLNLANSQVPAFETSTTGNSEMTQSGNTWGSNIGNYANESSGYNSGSQSGFRMGK